MNHRSLLDRAVDALRRAADEPNNGERHLLLEEALRLNRLALETEHAATTRGPPMGHK
jgi:hypothetical protein